MKKNGVRRLVLVLLVLVLLAGLAGAALFVMKRGRQREDLYAQATLALREDREEDAERLLRAALDAQPAHVGARTSLVNLLFSSGRLEDAEEQIALGEKASKTFAAWYHRGVLALLRMDLAEAERIAREHARHSPEQALGLIAVVRDMSPHPRDRRAAVDVARQLAEVASRPSNATQALVFAGETLLDLLPDYHESVRPAMEAQARRDLARAEAALREARATGESGTELDVLLARIQVLGEDRNLVLAGERMLEKELRERPERHEVRAALAQSYLRREQWEAALDLARELEEGPGYLWFRTVRRVGRAGLHGEALKLLEGAPWEGRPEVLALKADLLLKGDAAARAQAADVLGAWIERIGTPEAAHAAYSMLSKAGEEEAALALLEERAGAQGGAALQAVYASALAASGASGRAAKLAEDLARVEDASPAVLIEIWRGGEDLALRYLRPKAQADGPAGSRARALAALAIAGLLRSEPPPEDAAALRDEAAALLDRLAADPDPPPLALNGGVFACGLLEMPDRAGALAGRLLVAAADHEALATQVLGTALNLPGEVRAAIARGMRGTAGSAGAYAPMVRAIADAIEDRLADRAALLAALDDVAQNPATAPAALRLALVVAAVGRDVATMERYAQRLVELQPYAQSARNLLAQVYMLGGDYPAVLRTHREIDGVDFLAHWQKAVALGRLERHEEALEVALAAVDAHPANPDAHLLASGVLEVLDRPREALELLAVAPQNREILLRRASLMRRLGSKDAARGIYADLITATPADLAAWNGLYAVVPPEEFAATASRGLESLPEDAPQRTALITMRGSAYEASGRLTDAARDYDAAVERGGDEAALALNNLADLLRRTAPERLDEARDYAARALKHRPKDADFMHTAAAILHAQGEHDAALRGIDEALAVRRTAEFALLRADVLAALGRGVEAREELERVVREFSGAGGAAEAERRLAAMDAEEGPVIGAREEEE